jgi:hypothetical protein
MKTQTFETVLYDYRHNSQSDRYSGTIDPHQLNIQRNLSGFSKGEFSKNNTIVDQVFARILCLVAISSLFYFVTLLV